RQIFPTTRNSGRSVPAAILACALLLLSACGHHAPSRASQTGASQNANAGSGGLPVAQVSIARRGAVQPTIALSGLIAPLQNVGITSSLSEPADNVYVNEGERVTRGQPLAQLDTADLQANLIAAQRNAAEAEAKVNQTQYQATQNIQQGGDQVRSASAAVAQAGAALAQDQADLSRDQSLAGRGYLAAQTLQQQQTKVRSDAAAVSSAQAALATARSNQTVNGTGDQGLQAANIAAAQAAAASARASIQQLQVQIDKATIRSPIDGVVVNRNFDPGEYPGTRTLFTLQKISQVYAELNAPTSQVFLVQPGQRVRLTASDFGGRSFEGTVDAVLGQVAPGSTNFTVKAVIDNSNDVLRSGMEVNATLDLPGIAGVTVPDTAFLDDSHSSIMVVRDGVTRTVDVHERGSADGLAVVAGLSPGARVVTNGQAGLIAGQRVAVR
ncbi:MAG: efflux RND transporter periplasmic adaptor subunit, partial [Candidatus Eremiobacteraeota bacterium]|nr:efflux RND transporter periplasmic adaptor subunit [Candidatus Eremiobacteraeota bacterium]